MHSVVSRRSTHRKRNAKANANCCCTINLGLLLGRHSSIHNRKHCPRQGHAANHPHSLRQVLLCLPLQFPGEAFVHLSPGRKTLPKTRPVCVVFGLHRTFQHHNVPVPPRLPCCTLQIFPRDARRYARCAPCPRLSAVPRHAKSRRNHGGVELVVGPELRPRVPRAGRGTAAGAVRHRTRADVLLHIRAPCRKAAR